MPYSHINYYPSDIVHQFATSCKEGQLDQLDSYFPPKENFFQKLVRIKNGRNINRDTHIFEYDYAFWFGLEKAAESNQVEVIEYLLNHQKLKHFKEKKEVKNIKDKFNKIIEQERNDRVNRDEMESQTFDGPEPDQIDQIDVTRAINCAAENASFESFEIIREIDVWAYANIEEVYMGFFRKITPNKLDKLLSIPDLSTILKNNLDIALSHIIIGKNEFALSLLKNHFKVESHLIINSFDSYNDYHPEYKQFREWALMEISVQSKEKGRSGIKKI